MISMCSARAFFFALCWLWAGLVPLPAQKPGQGAPERPEAATGITVQTPLVMVNVVVTDEKGNLVRGLEKEHFRVFDEGVEQKVTNFFTEKAPINVVLAMECSQVITGLETDFWDAVDAFAEYLRPEDYCALVVFDNRPRIAIDFTDNIRKMVKEARSRVFFKGFRDSCLSDAVIFVLDRMKDVPGRKAAIFLSTGLDTFSRATYQKALDAAGASDTVLYAVSMGQLSRTLNDYRYADETRAEFNMADLRLKSFAKRTGGEALFPRFITEYPSVFRGINQLIRHQYTLAFQPSDARPGKKLRKITVEVAADINNDGKPEKLRTICREGYMPPKP